MGPDALGRLIDAHGAALMLFARQWCAAAEDVVQDALLKLAAADPPPARPVPWLYAVVRTGALMAARADRRRKAHEGRAAARGPAWFAPADPSGPDAEAAAAALARLPPDQREAIVAHLWGGLTFAEVGELTGVSATTAYRRYAAGLTALRDELRVPCPAPNRPATPR